jgi:hypothetical protein
LYDALGCFQFACSSLARTLHATYDGNPSLLSISARLEVQMVQTDGTDGPVDRFLAAVESGNVSDCDAWADAVVLDATVPNWRLRRRGASAVRDEYARWFAHPGRFETLRRVTTDSGEVVEYTLVWEEDGVPHAAHHMHLLETADGAIASDTVMCGGRWPAALLAEMAAAEGG